MLRNFGTITSTLGRFDSSSHQSGPPAPPYSQGTNERRTLDSSRNTRLRHVRRGKLEARSAPRQARREDEVGCDLATRAREAPRPRAGPGRRRPRRALGRLIPSILQSLSYDKLFSMQDALTQFFTHRDFSENLEKANTWALIVDIDGLCWLNDQIGFETGSNAVLAVANLLRKLVSGLENYSIYRIGGDKFLVITDHPEHIALEFANSVVKVVHAEEIHYQRPDQPARKILEVNVMIIRLTGDFLRNDFSKFGLSDEYKAKMSGLFFEQKVQQGKLAGVVVDGRN